MFEVSWLSNVFTNSLIQTLIQNVNSTPEMSLDITWLFTNSFKKSKQEKIEKETQERIPETTQIKNILPVTKTNFLFKELTNCTYQNSN